MKPITIKQYNKIMDKIIAKNLPPDEALIEMLEIASKYKIKEEKWKK